jgi:hypothetical protein
VWRGERVDLVLSERETGAYSLLDVAARRVTSAAAALGFSPIPSQTRRHWRTCSARTLRPRYIVGRWPFTKT